MNWLSRLLLIGQGLALALVAPATLGQVLISPVLVDLTAQKRMVAVSVSLGASARSPILFQANLQSWRQVNGEPQQSDSEDLLISPAIAEINPGETQIFRIGLRSSRPDAEEAAYRLILEDVSEIDNSQVKPGSIVFRLNHDLPVFVEPLAAPQILARWSTCAAAVGKGCVRLDNDGNRRIRFSELAVAGTGWQQEIRDTATTVLAGAWKQWSFDLPAGRDSPARITGKTELGAISADLSAPKP